MSGGSDVLGLRLPADTEYIRYARLLAAAVGDAAELDVDQLDDLRIGIDEACVVLIEQAEPSGPLQLDLAVEDEGVVVTGSCPSTATGQGIGPGQDDLQAQILAAVVDDISFELDGGRASFRLHKRR